MVNDDRRPVRALAASTPANVPDLSEVRGQALARRALEVAAAGGHHLFMHGPPGSGKTMLARRLPGIVPPLTDDQALAAACVWAAAGRRRGVDHTPPFRSPHHTASLAALVGGGSGVVVPGEISLASHGVLFLDELGEFPARTLDALRQPLEEGAVAVARRGISVTFPACVQLVAASNPCPCGYAGDRVQSCRCLPAAVERYRRRVSGPILDRFDLRVAVRRPSGDDLRGPPGETTAAVSARVATARAAQRSRGTLNRDLGRSLLDDLPTAGPAGQLLHRAVERSGLTARGFDRIRRVARTLADLEGVDLVEESHVAEALALRGSW